MRAHTQTFIHTQRMPGLSGSGKSTIARALEERLVVEMGLHVQNLDGDNVISRDPT